jgi:hypothetical protein
LHVTVLCINSLIIFSEQYDAVGDLYGTHRSVSLKINSPKQAEEEKQQCASTSKLRPNSRFFEYQAQKVPQVFSVLVLHLHIQN